MIHQQSVTIDHPGRVVINIIIVIIGNLGHALVRIDIAADITDMEERTRGDVAPAATGAVIIKVVSVVRGMSVVVGIEVVIKTAAATIHLLLNHLLQVVIKAVVSDLHRLLPKDTGKEIPEEVIIVVRTEEVVPHQIPMSILISRRKRLLME